MPGMDFSGNFTYVPISLVVSSLVTSYRELPVAVTLIASLALEKAATYISFQEIAQVPFNHLFSIEILFRRHTTTHYLKYFTLVSK